MTSISQQTRLKPTPNGFEETGSPRIILLLTPSKICGPCPRTPVLPLDLCSLILAEHLRWRLSTFGHLEQKTDLLEQKTDPRARA